MTNLVVVGDALLEEMVQAIVGRVHPLRIVLFGSRARGDARADSDYDIMVEYDFDLPHRDAQRQVSAALTEVTRNVDIFVRKPGEFELRRDDPGRMDWDIARQGIVLYPAGVSERTLRPVATPGGIRVREDGPPPSLWNWLAHVDRDLASIHNHLTSESPEWGYVCFHSQQAAEKLLKALLIQRYIRPPRTHNLTDLVVLVRQAGYLLPDLATECELLRPYASDVRYPYDDPIPSPPPDEKTGREAIEAGKRIMDAVRLHLR